MITKVKKIKSPYQNVIFSILLGILASGVIGFLVISTWKINQRRAESTARIEALKKEIQIREEKNQQLRAGILETTKESYWEEKIRQEGYKRPGEEQVVVLPPEKSQEEEVKVEKNPLQKFLEKFGLWAGLVERPNVTFPR